MSSIHLHCTRVKQKIQMLGRLKENHLHGYILLEVSVKMSFVIWVNWPFESSSSDSNQQCVPDVDKLLKKSPLEWIRWMVKLY